MFLPGKSHGYIVRETTERGTTGKKEVVLFLYATRSLPRGPDCEAGGRGQSAYALGLVISAQLPPDSHVTWSWRSRLLEDLPG